MWSVKNFIFLATIAALSTGGRFDDAVLDLSKNPCGIYFTAGLSRYKNCLLREKIIVPECHFESDLHIKEIRVPAGDNVTLDCSKNGDHYVWFFPKRVDDETRVKIIRGALDNGTISLYNLSYMYTGPFICLAVTSIPCQYVEKSYFLYVKDKNENLMSFHQLSTSINTFVFTQNETAHVVCAPTSPEIDVELFLRTSNNNSEPETKIDLNSPDKNGVMYWYNPYEGFETNDTLVPGVKKYTCRFRQNSKETNVYCQLIIKPLKSSIPSPSLSRPGVISDLVDGERLVLQCSLKTEKNISLQWITPHADLNKRAKIVNNTIRNEIISWLIVEKAETSDTGTYYCLAKDKTEEFNIKEIHVFVNKYFIELFVDLPRLHINFLPPEEGVSFSWNVYYNGYPKPYLYWSKNGKPFPVDHLPQSLITYTPTLAMLKIVNMSDTHFGNYSLVAMNSKVRKEVHVNFNTLLEHTANVLSPDLDEGLLKCVAGAYPTPRIFWYLKNCYDNSCSFRPLSGNDSHSEKNGLQVISYLKINSSWSGFLKCEANNSLVTDTVIQEVTDKKIDFDICGRNVVHFDNGQKRVDVNVHDNLTISCVTSHFNYREDTKWKVNKLDSIKAHLDRYNTIYTDYVNLTIYNISKENEGIGTCTTSAKNGSTYDKYIKIVVGDTTYLPNIYHTNMDKEDKEIEVLSTSDLKLDCQSNGYPSPHILWMKDNIVLHYSKKFDISDYNQTLIIKHFTEDDEGLYKCSAFNSKGTDFREVFVKLKTPSFIKDYWYVLLIILILLAILLISFALTVSKIRNERKFKRILKRIGLENFIEGAVDRLNPELELNDQADCLPYDRKWEIPMENLKLGIKLGSGAFGVVMKGELTEKDGSSVEVAVKTLGKSANITALKALASELKIMIHLGCHVNIVNLLGACTKTITKGELFVIVEYCPFGNLHNYLQKHKQYFVNQINAKGHIDYSIGQDILGKVSSKKGSPKSVVRYVKTPSEENLKRSSSNIKFETIPNDDDRGDYISTEDLIAWGLQVAQGMEYLSSRKVLHGDLASRNILLSRNNVVKICDFGLSKNMYYSDIYKKSEQVPLPIKWMALESISSRIFSIQSDVWSFGVVLWEFFSLGEIPYPTTRVDDEFVKKLSEGYRMPSPEFAPKQLYRIMLDCWQADPLLRPSFIELVDQIGDILEDPVKKFYIDLNNSYVTMNKHKRSNNDQDYLAMMKAPNFGDKSGYLTPTATRRNASNSTPTETQTAGYLSMEAAGGEMKDEINFEDKSPPQHSSNSSPIQDPSSSYLLMANAADEVKIGIHLAETSAPRHNYSNFSPTEEQTSSYLSMGAPGDEVKKSVELEDTSLPCHSYSNLLPVDQTSSYLPNVDEVNKETNLEDIALVRHNYSNLPPMEDRSFAYLSIGTAFDEIKNRINSEDTSLPRHHYSNLPPAEDSQDEKTTYI